MPSVISLDTEKMARRGFQHGRPGSSPLEKQGGGWVPPDFLPGSNAYEFLKTPSHRLVRSQYRGIVWAKEEGSWRDLDICVSPKVEVGGGGLLLPLSLESGGGGKGVLAPPRGSYPYDRPGYFHVLNKCPPY